MRREVWILDRKTTAHQAVVFLPEGSVVTVPAALLPTEARAGDRLLVEIEDGPEAALVRVRVDSAASRAARARVERRLEKLEDSDSGEDVEL